MKKELFINGVGDMAIIKTNHYYFYYIVDEKWECYKGCTRKEFIEELKRISWTCLTSWDKELRKEYLDLVDYTNEIGKEI